MDIEISIRDPAWHSIEKLDQLVVDISTAFLQEFGKTDSYVAVTFADDQVLAELNGKWRGKSLPTNVLSFPSLAIGQTTDDTAFLGDVILASGVTRREAAEQNKTWSDHTAHLIIHGILHLLGNDHETAIEAEQMETIEIAILAKLGISNPYEI